MAEWGGSREESGRSLLWSFHNICTSKNVLPPVVNEVHKTTMQVIEKQIEKKDTPKRRNYHFHTLTVDTHYYTRTYKEHMSIQGLRKL